MCRSGAGAWYPKVYSEQAKVKLETLHEWLELLFLDGLVEKAPGTKETGPGVILTDLGRQVLADDDALERLRQGRAINALDRGGAVREMLLKPSRPFVTRIILFANLLWFGYSCWLAWQMKAVSLYLSGDLASLEVNKIVMMSGGLGRAEWIHGEWWRVITAAFVHIGLLHLGMNMLWLFSAGGMAERMWGSGPLLVLYVFSALGCSFLGLAKSPIDSAGASGALCGMLAAELIWVALNGRYLPREMLIKWRWQLASNILMMAALSYFFRGVGGWGHLGGAFAGLICALLLTFLRFGPFPWKAIAIPLFAVIPWAGWTMVEQSRQDEEVWKKAEKHELDIYYLQPIRSTLIPMKERTRLALRLITEVGVQRDKKEAVQSALDVTTEDQEKLQQVEALLDHAGPYRHPDVQDQWRMAGDDLKKFSDLLKTISLQLSKWLEVEKSQVPREQEFETVHLQELARNSRAANKFIRDVLQPLMAKPAAKRPPAEVTKAYQELGILEKKLDAQRSSFLRMDHFWNPSIEEARQKGFDYLRDATRYCRMAQDCLTSDRWSNQQAKQLDELTQRVTEEAKALEDLFEK